MGVSAGRPQVGAGGAAGQEGVQPEGPERLEEEADLQVALPRGDGDAHGSHREATERQGRPAGAAASPRWGLWEAATAWEPPSPGRGGPWIQPGEASPPKAEEGQEGPAPGPHCDPRGPRVQPPETTSFRPQPQTAALPPAGPAAQEAEGAQEWPLTSTEQVGAPGFLPLIKTPNAPHSVHSVDPLVYLWVRGHPHLTDVAASPGSALAPALKCWVQPQPRSSPTALLAPSSHSSPLPPPPALRAGGLGTREGRGRPVQTTVLSQALSGCRGPPSPPRGGPSWREAGRRGLALAGWPRSEVSWTGLAALVQAASRRGSHPSQSAGSHPQRDINRKINSVASSPHPSLYKNTKSSELGRLALRSRPVRGSRSVGCESWEQRSSRLWS